MSPPGQASSTDGRRSRRPGAGGFALVEVGLALLIVVLAAGLGFDLLGRVQQRRRCDQFVADLREFAAAFQSYARQHEAGTSAGTDDAALPASMEDLLQDTNWRKGSPFGGSYGWVPPDSANPPADGSGRGRAGAIALTAFAPSFPLTLTKRDLRYIDASIDDGNLATGRFRTGFNGWPIYLVGEDR
jgi:type II secretory pathway pseudopilin PulG